MKLYLYQIQVEGGIIFNCVAESAEAACAVYTCMGLARVNVVHESTAIHHMAPRAHQFLRSAPGLDYDGHGQKLEIKPLLRKVEQ